MAGYEPVTPPRLQEFLTRLGRTYRRPGRVFLVGGTGLLYQGLKLVTKDVDLTTLLPPQDHEQFWRAVRRLSHELNMAIEEVSPAHFIPLPSGVEERHRYLGRHGHLEVFAFDPVSTALSKIARSRPADVTDVLGLIAEGQLGIDTLLAAFEEILPRIAAGQALKIGPDEYRQKMAAFLDEARALGLTAQPGAADPGQRPPGGNPGPEQDDRGLQ